MANRHRPRGGRTTPRGTRPPERSSHSGRELPPLVGDAQSRLRERSPLPLLEMASSLIEATTSRPTDTWAGGSVERPDGSSTFRSFAESGIAPMEALALAVATLHGDEVLAARLRATVGASTVPGAPPWLATLDKVEITDTMVQGDILGDGENIVVSWRWPDGRAGTVVVYIDHNMGTIVKDAFGVPDGISTLLEAYDRLGEAKMTQEPIDPAAARARIAEAIRSVERVVPPWSTDTWPAYRPIVEWVLRHLPAGGTGYVRPEWSEDRRDHLLDDFVDSSYAVVSGLTREVVRELADPLLWFACDYGPGDPLRWSSVSVEIVLSDWYPRKVFGLADAELRRLPDVLAGFVRFAHHRQGVPTDRTDETLAAIERWRGDFLEAIIRPGRSPGANAMRLARIAAGLDLDDGDLDDTELFDLDDNDGDDDDGDDGYGYGFEDDEAYMARTVVELQSMVTDLVGGPTAYEALDDEPLGEVPFDWSGVPDEMRGLTGETLDHLDRWAVELFDVEVRSIARCVLAAVLAADHGVFKRSPRPDALAAAILSFLLLRLTGRFSSKERRALPWKVFTQKDLAVATGVSASTIGSRTKTVANVVERATIDWPSILHSTQRREALRTKRVIADWRQDHS